MSDTKSANRRPNARDEGIYKRDVNFHCALVCTICGRGGLGTFALTKASHAKKHVREGKVVARTERGYDGLRTVWEKA